MPNVDEIINEEKLRYLMCKVQFLSTRLKINEGAVCFLFCFVIGLVVGFGILCFRMNT